MPDPNKDGIDTLFDIADNALDSIGKVLVPASPKQVSPSDEDDLSEQWESGWTEPHWGPAKADDGIIEWHAFRNGGMRSVCTRVFNSNQMQGRRVLEHGKTIAACTSCIIGVSK